MTDIHIFPGEVVVNFSGYPERVTCDRRCDKAWGGELPAQGTAF